MLGAIALVLWPILASAWFLSFFQGTRLGAGTRQTLTSSHSADPSVGGGPVSPHSGKGLGRGQQEPCKSQKGRKAAAGNILAARLGWGVDRVARNIPKDHVFLLALLWSLWI